MARVNPWVPGCQPVPRPRRVCTPQPTGQFGMGTRVIDGYGYTRGFCTRSYILLMIYLLYYVLQLLLSTSLTLSNSILASILSRTMTASTSESLTSPARLQD